MATQDILFIVGLSSLGLAVLLLGVAAYIFFNRNIPDIMADLNGTKRAEALAAMAKENSRLRRRSRAGESTGNIAIPTEGMSSKELDSARQVSVDNGTGTQDSRKSGLKADGEEDVTTVMADDSSATTVLAPDSADATTLLVQEESDAATIDSKSATGRRTETQNAPAAIVAVSQNTVTEEPIPDSFHIVRKIVLTQSAEFIKPGQGESYA